MSVAVKENCDLLPQGASTWTVWTCSTCITRLVKHGTLPDDVDILIRD